MLVSSIRPMLTTSSLFTVLLPRLKWRMAAAVGIAGIAGICWQRWRRHEYNSTVFSTPFDDDRAHYPVLQASVNVQKYCRELGCSCYNPNTDNTRGEDGWLLCFLDALEQVRCDRGCMLVLLPPGLQPTDMQIAEMRLCKLYGIPVRHLHLAEEVGSAGTPVGEAFRRKCMDDLARLLVR